MQTLIKLVYPTVSNKVKYLVWFLVLVVGFMVVARLDYILVTNGLLN